MLDATSLSNLSDAVSEVYNPSPIDSVSFIMSLVLHTEKSENLRTRSESTVDFINLSV